MPNPLDLTQLIHDRGRDALAQAAEIWNELEALEMQKYPENNLPEVDAHLWRQVEIKAHHLYHLAQLQAAAYERRAQLAERI